MNLERIPFNDLNHLHTAHREAFHRRLDELIDRSDFIGGQAIRDFESAFANACEVSEVVGVANGTEALFVCLKICGVGPGDLVVTVPNSFIATSEAISLCGADPLFIDVDANDFNMDVCALENTLGQHPERQRIKAVLPVHLHGRPAKLDVISALCKKHQLPLIADAAQAHLAHYQGRAIAQWADLTTFSFYPGKNLGALGDAGAIASNKCELLAKARRFANHGRSQKYIHQEIGTNARLDTLQAHFLLEKLSSLKDSTTKRQKLAQRYMQELQAVPDLSIPVDHPECPSVVHLMVILHKHRDALQKHLSTHQIETGIHYPLPLHLQPAYRHLNHQEGDFPVCEQLAKTQLSLPLFPHMSEAQLLRVCEVIQSFHP